MLPLKGIKIVDMTRTLAGPFATMMLGDLGAEVIKIERPGSGDEARQFTPPSWGEESCYYLSSNRNKRSVTVDIKSEKGQEIIKKLVADSDVFVENFKTDSLEKIGLGYEDLKLINEKLIYCSISGFGRTGPDRHKPGYDILIQGYSGLMSVTGEKDRGHVKVGTSIADLTAGMMAVYGILSAVLERSQSGEGQLIDVSLLDGQIMFLNHLATGYFATGKPAGKMGAAHPTLVPYQAFSAEDIDIILAIANDEQWKRCCDVLEWTDLKTDEKFYTNQKRVENRQELIPIIEERFKSLSSRTIIEKLDFVSVPCGPVHTLDQILKHPQVKARDMMIEMEHPVIEGLRVPGFPVKFSKSPLKVRRHPPMLGEHTDEILEHLGYSEQDVDEMRTNRNI